MSGWKAERSEGQEKPTSYSFHGASYYYDQVEFEPVVPSRRWSVAVIAFLTAAGSLACFFLFNNGFLPFSTSSLSHKHVPNVTSPLASADFLIPSHPGTILAGSESSALPHRFSLKHVYHHNTEDNPQAHGRLDVTEQVMEKYSLLNAYAHVGDETVNDKGESVVAWDTSYSLSVVPKQIRRMSRRDPDYIEGYLEFARLHPKNVRGMEFDWVDETVLAPNISDRDTLIQLAYMSANAYVDVPFTGDWTNVSEPWDNDAGFGWMSDGVRGYVFVDETETIAIIAIKGTSAAVFDSGGDTAPNDKVNDNLLFSCCCARISYLWNTVCDCYTGDSYTCDQECLEEQLYNEDRYYRAVLDVYRNVTSMYPNVPNVWATGHSLGGSLSSLLARTYGIPAVGIEAPGELLAAKRLHLPMPPGVPLWEDYIWHFGHTADPVYMGVCNGAGSSCWIAGYAMETQCHAGLQCLYDVVEDKGWHMSMVNHRIHVVIDDVIMQYNNTPECVVPPPCADCFNWKFVVPEPEPDPKPTTTSTKSKTPKTKTETKTSAEDPTSTDGEKCIRRAWYGKCLEYGPGEAAIERITIVAEGMTAPSPVPAPIGRV